ncbi:glycosyltransferase family 2 protein [Nocardioides marmoriginsengisoli]|uniref:glycosyltransferase family 2 protein n=1 Tax=Nocardioides marmoriginsengisoli TaxID=661483 RepID=UPI00160B4453|nr:glycosyltransferase family 2 protein [Nocardioides marmoriginsengisoli]
MTPRTTGVVILNYGDPGDTLRCLRSLENSTDLDMDILVVNNGPEDALHEELVREVGSRASVISTGDNLGYAAGNNLGISWVMERGCDLVWILNPDTLVAPTTLAILREHLDATPDCGMVGPRLVLPGKPPRIWFDGGLVDLATAVTEHVNLGVPVRKAPAPVVRDADYVTGASLLVRRLVVEQVGPIPDQYFLYCEEVDWCRRVAAAGWRVMVDQRATMHHLKRSSTSLPKPYYLYYMTRNRYLFAEDSLGLDGEVALAHLDQVFLAPYRRNVERDAPHWLAAFDDLVALAKADARNRVYGRNDVITQYPSADEEVHVTHGA